MRLASSGSVAGCQLMFWALQCDEALAEQPGDDAPYPSVRRRRSDPVDSNF